MVAYDDVATYTFVFLYDRPTVTARAEAGSVERLLHEAELVPRSNSNRIVDLKEVALGGGSPAPVMLTLNGGEGYTECKLVPEVPNRLVELQLGAAEFLEKSFFSDSHYTIQVRDRLVTCVEALTCIPGFHGGFAAYIGDEENEIEYREWLAECLVGDVLSLSRLVRHEWLTTEAVFAGPPALDRFSRELFMKCPAWRTSSPCDDTICVFYDNVIPGAWALRKERVSHVREALAYLRAALPEE